MYKRQVVICAFSSFLRRTSEGAYTGVNTRDDLWRLLARITRHQALKQRRFLGRRKRRTSNVVSDEALLKQLTSKTPAPEVVLSVSETLNELLSSMPSERLRQIALFRLQGLSNAEIAVKLNRSVRTIERRIELIRITWQRKEQEL